MSHAAFKIPSIRSGEYHTIARLHGSLTGLKPKQIKVLERLYRRKIPPGQFVHLELGRELALLSYELSCQIGLLIDRQGIVRYVIIGDARGIEIPELGRARAGMARLRGLRCVHTHLNASPLSQEDLTDMALLRLDAMGVIEVVEDGNAGRFHFAHIKPRPSDENTQANGHSTFVENRTPWETQSFPNLESNRVNIEALINSLESEFARLQKSSIEFDEGERALLVHLDTGKTSNRTPDTEFEELSLLTREAGFVPCGQILQRRKKPDPRFVIGKGRLADVLMNSMQVGAEALFFSNELTPSQIKNLSVFTDLKILDRTQIILDIFAQRAKSRVGKLQVELALLRYTLPRISSQHTALSRLTGGIGGRGPGETKLEIHRRRAFERIRRVEKELGNLQKKRSQGRRLRQRRQVPVLSLVGYTNAGKSTLLNALTNSETLAEDRLFATLDTSSRRLRLPREQEVIITDTVGFIHDLPQELIGAFRSTLEELSEADLLLHVIDASSPHCEENLFSVEKILDEIGLKDTPLIRVFNKMDRTDDIRLANLCRRFNGIAVSGVDPESLVPLVEEADHRLLSMDKQDETQEYEQIAN